MLIWNLNVKTAILFALNFITYSKLIITIGRKFKPKCIIIFFLCRISFTNGDTVIILHFRFLNYDSVINFSSYVNKVEIDKILPKFAGRKLHSCIIHADLTTSRSLEVLVMWAGSWKDFVLKGRFLLHLNFM